MVLLLAISRLDYRCFHSRSIFLISLGVVLLFIVLCTPFGKEVGGAKRWLRFGPVCFQPSEIVKFFVIIYMADFLSRFQDELNFKRFLLFLAPVGLVCLLILLQPHFGMVLLIGLATFSMLLISKVKLRYILALLSASLPILYFLVFEVGYRKNRILAFLNPSGDPLGKGYQIIQSQIALGSGGMFGIGLGQGKQKLFFLPQAHNDFIFSIIGEELGFFGGTCLILLFLAFIFCGIKISLGKKDFFGKFLAFGIVSIIGIQILINLGVVTGLLPTTGLPLIFISYGGSSLIFNLMAVGLLMSIYRHEFYITRKGFDPK
jgi:cell division protein FtsW